jgi:hypothetical protein
MMRNFIFKTTETVHAVYNVLVENNETEEDAKKRFERGEYDSHLQVDAHIESIDEVYEGN